MGYYTHTHTHTPLCLNRYCSVSIRITHTTHTNHTHTHCVWINTVQHQSYHTHTHTHTHAHTHTHTHWQSPSEPALTMFDKQLHTVHGYFMGSSMKGCLLWIIGHIHCCITLKTVITLRIFQTGVTSIRCLKWFVKNWSDNHCNWSATSSSMLLPELY